VGHEYHIRSDLDAGHIQPLRRRIGMAFEVIEDERF
jgi:hypothetical protein